MALTEASAAIPSIDREQRRRRIRRWVGVAILATLIAAGICSLLFGDDLDARESALLSAWSSSWIAAVVWLLTDLRGWYCKLFFGLSVLTSFASATQGQGLWYAECFHHSETTDYGSTSWSYCVPHLGTDPAFRQ